MVALLLLLLLLLEADCVTSAAVPLLLLLANVSHLYDPVLQACSDAQLSLC
jgi:hypothetical protein